MKEQSMKISDYFEFIKPTYIFLKITPSTGIRNYNSDKFISLVAGLYSSIDRRIKKIENKLFFECESKLGYYIYMEKSDVQFYFVVPQKQYNLFKDKIIDTWANKITISNVDNIPNFSMDCTKFYVTYKKVDALSLTCDRRNNTLLASQLNTLHVMEDGDKVGIFYNFIPTYQKSWRAKWDNTINDIRNDLPANHDKFSVGFVIKTALSYAVKLCDAILGSISFSDMPAETKKVEKYLELSKSSEQKRNNVVVDTQIICMSESKDKLREYNNAVSLCSSFECLDEDNQLVYKQIKKDINLLDTKIKYADKIKVQPKEGQNFISIPGRELLMEHKAIEHTNVLETDIPIKLRTGYISLGMNICRGKSTEAFQRDTYDQGNFPLVLVGEQGSGKTTYISNYVKCIQSKDEGCILIDYIKNCELSETIKKATPSNRIVELDMSDVLSAQGIGYNELKARSNKPLDILDVANRKALYIQMLVDALNTDGDPLSSSMDRYLSAASNIVFLNENASLKDVVKCLNNHQYRHECISSVPMSLYNYLDEEIGALKELDDTDKEGNVIGTRMVRIDGINHRINLLRKDLRLKMMFNKNCEDNIDLVKCMDEGKIILIKMPQEYFSTPYSKNVIVTYLFTKIWVATIIRGGKQHQPKRFHILVDEIFQSKTSMKLLREQEILPQTRKFGSKFVFSCQYLGQIELIDQTLRSAGASYMLMKGSGKANFNEFKDELYPYTLEDLEALPQYSSLNLINYEEGRAKFITRLPSPI